MGRKSPKKDIQANKQETASDSNKQTKLRLLDEHILKLMKDLVELQEQRCKLTGMETGTRKSAHNMLSGPEAARLMGVSQ